MNELITANQIYWLTRCDGIKEFFNFSPLLVALFIICSIIAILSLIVSLSIDKDCSDYECVPTFRKTAKISGSSSIVLMILLFLFDLISVFTPSTKEMAAIVVIPRIANSQSVQSIGVEIVDLAKQWMVELSPEKVKQSITNQTNEN